MMKILHQVFTALGERFVSISMYQSIFFCDPSVFNLRFLEGHIVIINFNFAKLLTVTVFERPFLV